MKTSKRLVSATAIGLVTLTATPAAFAYLDPGTGSFVLQMIIAGALGAMFYIKTAWAGTKAYLSRLFGGSSAESIDAPDSDTASTAISDLDSTEIQVETNSTKKAE